MVLSVIFKKKFPNCGAFDRNCGVFWEKNSGRVLALFGPEKGAFWFKTFSHFGFSVFTFLQTNMSVWIFTWVSFFTFELILISAQYADCRDGGFSIYCKGPPKYLHSRSLNKKYILMALNWKHIIKLKNGINDWHLTISGQGVPLFHLRSTYNSLFKYLFWEHFD